MIFKIILIKITLEKYKYIKLTNYTTQIKCILSPIRKRLKNYPYYIIKYHVHIVKIFH